MTSMVSVVLREERKVGISALASHEITKHQGKFWEFCPILSKSGWELIPGKTSDGGAVRPMKKIKRSGFWHTDKQVLALCETNSSCLLLCSSSSS